MKIWCSCLLLLSLIAVSGCVSMPSYEETSLRHHTYASGQIEATTAQWRDLISEFQAIINTDTHAPSADDAQYAIASCWLWNITTGDTEAPEQAIEAFQKLIHIYPNSQYVPKAHYWLGRCYNYIGDDYQAITQYQLIESRYADSDMADTAQLELARLYARQAYLTRAKKLYADLVASSTDEEIVAVATAESENLKTQQKPIVPLVPPHKKEVKQVQVQTQPEPKARPAPSISDPKPLAPESLTREFGLTAKTIVIDPGHGGKDSGALGNHTLQEKAVVLSISEKLRELLTRRGYRVLMTRDTNRFIPLRERTAFATQHKADLFLSVHANGSKNPEANGIETYYLNVTSTDKVAEAIAARENADSGYSIQELEGLLKGIIQESKREDSKRLAGHVQDALIQMTGAVDRGVKHARFVVLIGTNVPAILIETGFVSNPAEGQKLTTPAYQQKIATAIAQGVEAFLGKTDETPIVEGQTPKFAVKNAEGKR